MFKCKECGFEYEIKPEYCDCGNDTFEEVAASLKQESTSASKITSEQRPIPRPEKNQDTERLKNFFDPISTIVFLFCIITSIAVIFFIGNPKETAQNSEKKQSEEVQQVNIPDIESFWNNSTVGIINNEKTTKQVTAQTQPQQQPIANTPLAQIQPKQEQVQKTIPVPAPKTSAVEKIKQTITKTPTPQQPKQTQPVATTPVPKIPQKTQEIATQPKTPTTQSKPKITQNNIETKTQKPTQTQPSQPSQSTQSNQSNQQTTTKLSTDIPLRPKANIDPAAQAKELNNYKVSLRNTIGRKVDFTKVIGDGDCTISFSIDSSGKLINRTFTKQSSNITLNDAAYKAVMATPKYNPPPSGYKNETLNLKIHFQNGNYNISLQ